MNEQEKKIIKGVYDGLHDIMTELPMELMDKCSSNCTQPLLELLVDGGPVSGWRPIETAPKDETSFLIIDAKLFITVGNFSTRSGRFENTEECWAIENPTHWMPLPEPPK